MAYFAFLQMCRVKVTTRTCSEMAIAANLFAKQPVHIICESMAELPAKLGHDPINKLMNHFVVNARRKFCEIE